MPVRASPGGRCQRWPTDPVEPHDCVLILGIVQVENPSDVATLGWIRRQLVIHVQALSIHLYLNLHFDQVYRLARGWSHRRALSVEHLVAARIKRHNRKFIQVYRGVADLFYTRSKDLYDAAYACPAQGLASDNKRLHFDVAHAARPASTPRCRAHATDGDGTRGHAEVEGRIDAAFLEDARHIQPFAAVFEEGARRMREIAFPGNRSGIVGPEEDLLEAAVDSLEFHEARDEPWLSRAWARGILDRAVASHPGKPGCARGDTFDRLRSKAHFFDVNAGGKIFGHSVSPRRARS